MGNELILKCSSVNRNNWELTDGTNKYFAQIDKTYNKLSLPVVGDNVHAYVDEWGNYYITTIENRKNLLSRSNSGSKQPIASNIDVVFVVSSMNNEFNIGKLERFAIIGNINDSRLCFILTKKDLCDNAEAFIEVVKNRFPSSMVFATDATRNEGIEEILDYWKEGEVAIFIGSSGVGKSTIINAFADRELMKTGAIREKDSKGKHTTTSRNLFYLDNNRVVIDTPGVRAVGVSSYENDGGIKSIFAEIIELEKDCKYSNCTHTHEKECAIKDALEKGVLTFDLLNRYLKFKRKEKSRKEIMQEDNEDIPDWKKREMTKNRKKGRK